MTHIVAHSLYPKQPKSAISNGRFRRNVPFEMADSVIKFAECHLCPYVERGIEALDCGHTRVKNVPHLILTFTFYHRIFINATVRAPLKTPITIAKQKNEITVRNKLKK
jgi:hypothetical protein